MFILTVPWDLRSLWAIASISMKVYFLALFAMAGYSVFQLTKVSFHLLVLQKEYRQNKRAFPSKHFLTMRHVRQINYFFVLMFGACFSSDFFAILRALQNSAVSLSALTLDIFEPSAVYAFVVFVVLSCLQFFQWVVSSHFEYCE